MTQSFNAANEPAWVLMQVKTDPGGSDLYYAGGYTFCTNVEKAVKFASLDEAKAHRATFAEPVRDRCIEASL